MFYPLVQAEAAHKELSGLKTRLEYDLHVKTTSLNIDQAKCLDTRQKYPIKLKVNNHFRPAYEDRVVDKACQVAYHQCAPRYV